MFVGPRLGHEQTSPSPVNIEAGISFGSETSGMGHAFRWGPPVGEDQHHRPMNHNHRPPLGEGGINPDFRGEWDRRIRWQGMSHLWAWWIMSRSPDESWGCLCIACVVSLYVCSCSTLTISNIGLSISGLTQLFQWQTWQNIPKYQEHCQFDREGSGIPWPRAHCLVKDQLFGWVWAMKLSGPKLNYRDFIAIWVSNIRYWDYSWSSISFLVLSFSHWCDDPTSSVRVTVLAMFSFGPWRTLKSYHDGGSDDAIWWPAEIRWVDVKTWRQGL